MDSTVNNATMLSFSPGPWGGVPGGRGGRVGDARPPVVHDDGGGQRAAQGQEVLHVVALVRAARLPEQPPSHLPRAPRPHLLATLFLPSPPRPPHASGAKNACAEEALGVRMPCEGAVRSAGLPKRELNMCSMSEHVPHRGGGGGMPAHLLSTMMVVASGRPRARRSFT